MKLAELKRFLNNLDSEWEKAEVIVDNGNLNYTAKVSAVTENSTILSSVRRRIIITLNHSATPDS